MSILEVQIESMNERMQYQGRTRENPPIVMDYIPPLGDGDGYMPMEMLLMSLGTCSASSVAALLRRSGRMVSAMTVKISGVRRDQHPTSFEKIDLRFGLTSPDVTEEEVQKAIDVSEQSICPVWAMLKGNVTISATFDIVRDQE